MGKVTKEGNWLNLAVGDSIRIGRKYAKEHGCKIWKEGAVITLIEGHFEHDNGLYVEDETCPAIWDEARQDFDSIFHLFGNDLEWWEDCEVIKNMLVCPFCGQKDFDAIGLKRHILGIGMFADPCEAFEKTPVEDPK